MLPPFNSVSNQFCHQCGASISKVSTFCEGCGALVNQNFEYNIEKKPADSSLYTLFGNQKNPFLAALASFLWTGMGQVYNGNLLRGFAFLIGAIISSLVFFFPGILIWLYGIYDAYHTAKQMNEGEIPFVEHKLIDVVFFVLGTIAIIVTLVLVVGSIL